MTTLELIVFGIVVFSPFRGLLLAMAHIPRGGMAVFALPSLAGLFVLPESRSWRNARIRAPREEAAAKFKPWLRRNSAALIRY
jgi:hypothetical protein